MKRLLSRLNFGKNGLIPAIVQDVKTKKVLTLCYMNREALKRTLGEKKVYVYRRSRRKLMMKGQTSGCVQRVKKVFIDCQGNSILFGVEQVRGACHQGYFTCYFRQIDKKGRLRVVAKRVFSPKRVYS